MSFGMFALIESSEYQDRDCYITKIVAPLKSEVSIPPVEIQKTQEPMEAEESSLKDSEHFPEKECTPELRSSEYYRILNKMDEMTDFQDLDYTEPQEPHSNGPDFQDVKEDEPIRSLPSDKKSDGDDDDDLLDLTDIVNPFGYSAGLTFGQIEKMPKSQLKLMKEAARYLDGSKWGNRAFI